MSEWAMDQCQRYRGGVSGFKWLGWLSLTVIACSGNAVAEPLQRLFTTPADRLALERLKLMAPQPAQPADEREPGPPQLMRGEYGVSDPVIMRGVVLRERGAPVLWLNGSNTLAQSQRWQDLDIRFPMQWPKPFEVEFRADDQTVVLSPGQYWSRAGELVTEQYLAAPSTDLSQSDITRSDPMPHDDVPGSGVSAQSEGIKGPDVRAVIQALSPDTRIRDAERLLREGALSSE